MFACTKQGGQCLAVPDVCQTPTPAGPIPIPYPNLATFDQAKGDTVADKVLIIGKPTVTKASLLAQSSGDEAGTGNGVVSGTVRDQVSFKTASAKVMAQGHPIVYQGCLCAHNGNNANMPAGQIISPSQTKVIIGG
ncbi:MAG: DUF4150 domain-containing protein [Thermodesulfobacteriota bacterium]